MMMDFPNGAHVRPPKDSYILMEVGLKPLVYIIRPEYWGIEVVGSLPGWGYQP